MYTSNYDFQGTSVVKIVLKRPDGKILLIQEPEDNNWMPLHWGLPGGKPTETESLGETLDRKIKTDIGQDVEIKGLFKIEELLMKGRTVLMYIVIASCNGEDVSGEAKSYKWVSEKEIENMRIREFTEFYNRGLLLEYFKNPERVVTLEIFNTLRYYEMDDNPTYQEWFKSGQKEK